MPTRFIRHVRRAVVTALAVAAVAVAPGRAAAQSSDGYVVVVNSANPATTIAKGELAKLFTKKSRAWSDGTAALPVDLASDSHVRELFTQQVHGKSTRAISSYWQQQIFSGRDVPPPERKSDDEVLEFVRSNRGAVGYVSTSARLGSGVKTVTVSAN